MGPKNKSVKPRKPLPPYKLYVWTGFCTDYTPGLAFAIARTLADAELQVRKKYGGDPSEWNDWGTLTVRPLNRRTAEYVCGGG